MHGHARHLAPIAALGISRGLVFSEVELHQLFGGHGGEGVGFAGGVIAEFDFKNAILPFLNHCANFAAFEALRNPSLGPAPLHQVI